MMDIELVRVKARSIYPKGKGGPMPKRLAWLHPAAAVAFAKIYAYVVVSDMFRSPESSLKALKNGRGAAAPGKSSHNYGRAIDIDVKAAMTALGFTHKLQLDSWMADHGWYCWRNDGKLEKESWHYFYSDTPPVYEWDSCAGCHSLVAWWGRTMATLYPCARGTRTAVYVAWYEANKERLS